MWQRDTLTSRFLRALIPERIPWFAAPLYDQIARTAVSTYYVEVAGSVTAIITGGLVLDIGTGPGYVPIEIAKTAPRIRIVGIDSSKALVRRAQTNAEEAGVSDRVRFLKGNANPLHSGDNSYDLVISTGSLHAWKHPIQVINECFRVLKPGCEAWLLDPAQVMTPEAQQLLNRGLKGINRLALWWGALSSKLTPPYTVGEIQEIVRKTKFETGIVNEGKWLTVKLRKHVGHASESRRSCP